LASAKKDETEPFKLRRATQEKGPKENDDPETSLSRLLTWKKENKQEALTATSKTQQEAITATSKEWTVLKLNDRKRAYYDTTLTKGMSAFAGSVGGAVLGYAIGKADAGPRVVKERGRFGLGSGSDMPPRSLSLDPTCEMKEYGIRQYNRSEFESGTWYVQMDNEEIVGWAANPDAPCKTRSWSTDNHRVKLRLQPQGYMACVEEGFTFTRLAERRLKSCHSEEVQKTINHIVAHYDAVEGFAIVLGSQPRYKDQDTGKCTWHFDDESNVDSMPTVILSRSPTPNEKKLQRLKDRLEELIYVDVPGLKLVSQMCPA